MVMHPLAQPFSREAKPARTGDRRIGVLLLHGFSGSFQISTPVMAQSIGSTKMPMTVPPIDPIVAASPGAGTPPPGT